MKQFLKKLAFILLFPYLMAKAHWNRAALYKEGEPAKLNKWYKFRVDGAKCSEGSDYYAYFKKGSSKHLIVFLSGGGASWSKFTAARPMSIASMFNGEDGFYFPAVKPYLDLMLSGMLAARNPKNPFDDWNAIYLPYATADLHVGNREFPYEAQDGSEKVLYHCGKLNAKLSLDAASPMFAEADKLLVAGESAGAFGCVALADFVASYWPNIKDIAVYSDASQIWSPNWKIIVKDVWNAEESLRECIGDDGELIADWFERLGKKLPTALLLHSNSTFDDTLTPFQNMLNNNIYSMEGSALSDYNSHLKSANSRLKGLKNYRFFITELGKLPNGSTPHTASRFDKHYYSKTPEGPSLCEWLEKACCQPGGFKDPGNEGSLHV
jgi:hypothetical protein